MSPLTGHGSPRSYDTGVRGPSARGDILSSPHISVRDWRMKGVAVMTARDAPDLQPAASFGRMEGSPDVADAVTGQHGDPIH
jgi:hypothetical protein